MHTGQELPDDGLRAWSRRLGSFAMTDSDILALDAQASSAELSTTARAECWTARAMAWTQGHRLGRDTDILSGLIRLVRKPMPIGMRGQAVDAARRLAAGAADGDSTRLLWTLQVKLSLELLDHVPPWLREHALARPWILQAQGTPVDGSSGDRARHLEALVYSMAERETLRKVLDRALDALVLWTGVERGLLLLNAPGNRLVVRAARNLERRDLPSSVSFRSSARTPLCRLRAVLERNSKAIQGLATSEN